MNEDTNSDTGQTNAQDTSQNLISQSEAQMRKGIIVYAVLLLLKDGKVYSSEIISALRNAELIVVEGTLYPLLSRLAKDSVLAYEWQESEQGPPRKYYWLTDEGKQMLAGLKKTYHKQHASISKLEKGAIS
jgi:PadR family transcriptional regulator PadR